ncbi:unnamed protein product [Lactuca saligna]|uniref:Uncharacterized protein n=1 Tax=Lactuca saligna TaxID=75948 RepID=A0AA35ZRJ1_LACSI|nr:unnamed protein product [Lactuca saligna]
MEITPVHALNLTGVLFTSKRIIRANYFHFLSLSLFFLPLSVSLIITPYFHYSGHHFPVDLFNNFPQNHKAVSSHLLYILFIYISTLCAIATISYSTYHGFEGKHVSFFTALKSLTSSIFPIIATAIVAHALLFLISLTFLLFVGVVFTSGQSLGFVIDYNSIHFTLFSVVVVATLISVIIYFHLNWSLAFVIVVAESKWGLAPLIRSSYLIKGMRSVSFLLLLYFGIFSGIFVWLFLCGYFPMLGSFFLMLMFLRSTASNTVLYMYCKALHGELALEIDEGFDHHYINLPSDEEKVPQIVSVVAA